MSNGFQGGTGRFCELPYKHNENSEGLGIDGGVEGQSRGREEERYKSRTWREESGRGWQEAWAGLPGGTEDTLESGEPECPPRGPRTVGLV